MLSTRDISVISTPVEKTNVPEASTAAAIVGAGAPPFAAASSATSSGSGPGLYIPTP